MIGSATIVHKYTKVVKIPYKGRLMKIVTEKTRQDTTAKRINLLTRLPGKIKWWRNGLETLIKRSNAINTTRQDDNQKLDPSK